MLQAVENDLKYPLLQINLDQVLKNTKAVVDICNKRGINVAGVVKGFNALPEVSKQYIDGGCKYLATSRLEQIISLKNQGIKTPMMLIRIPMFCEIAEMVKHVDISLNSELETIDKIEEVCSENDLTHKIVLMYDLGDLREGFMDEEEFLSLALHVERDLKRTELAGIGTNLGCYGSVKPTIDNMTKLCSIAEKIEDKIGRKLEIISGGATNCLSLIMEDKIPKKINNLRIGEGISLCKDLQDLWGYDMSFMCTDTFVLKAQVVEIKDKPSHPIGEIFIDAFGNSPTYEDIGIRRRALLAVGKQDFGFHDKLIPKNDKVKIIGSSSDHLIVDVEDCRDAIKLGDIVEFNMYYAPMLYLTGSPSVSKIYV